MSTDNVLTERINVLPYPTGSVQPSEDQPIILEALQSLKDEVSQLKGIIDLQAEKIATLETMQEKQADNQLIQLQLINQLREATKKDPSKSPLIDELYSHMKATGLKQTTFAGAAKTLKVTKMRVLQLHGAIALDQRFIIIPSENHKQKLLIRLRGFYQEV